MAWKHELVPAHGYEMAWVRFAALRGKGLLRKLQLPFHLYCRLLAGAARDSPGQTGCGSRDGRLRQFSRWPDGSVAWSPTDHS
jgi:hypothetical protein